MAEREKAKDEMATGSRGGEQDRRGPCGATVGGPQHHVRSPAGTSRADPFIRTENEDDDGYDPYSDRRPDPEPLFERDPWG